MLPPHRCSVEPVSPDCTLPKTRSVPRLKIGEELKQGLIVCVRAGHGNGLCFVGIHGYFSLAQSHISMRQTEGREAEERPGVWCSAASCKIRRQTEELAVNKGESYQCGQVSRPVDTSLQERKLLKSQQSRAGGNKVDILYQTVTTSRPHATVTVGRSDFLTAAPSLAQKGSLSCASTSHHSGFINA